MVYFPTFTIIYYKNLPFVQANIPYMDGMGWHGHGFTMFHISLGCGRSNVEPPETNMEAKMDHWKGMFLSFLNSSIWGFQIPTHPCMSHLPGIETQHPCHSYPIYKTFVASEHMWATEKKKLLLSIKSWLVNRDPNSGLFQSPYNWVGCHPLHTPIGPGGSFLFARPFYGACSTSSLMPPSTSERRRKPSHSTSRLCSGKNYVIWGLLGWWWGEATWKTCCWNLQN